MRIVMGWLVRQWPLALVLLVWQGLVAGGIVTSRLLPPPSQILSVLAADVASGTLITHAAITMFRALTGFLLGAVAGIVFAAALARFGLFRRLFEPLVFLGYPIPKIAFFPIFVFIFGIGSASKIAFAFLECMFPVLVACYLGFKGINARLVLTATNFGADRLTILRRVIVPAAMPSIFAGLQIALPVAMIVVVITEMIGDSTGLGYYINIYGARFEFARVYAGIVVVGVCGMALEAALRAIRRRALAWQRDEAAF